MSKPDIETNRKTFKEQDTQQDLHTTSPDNEPDEIETAKSIFDEIVEETEKNS